MTKDYIWNLSDLKDIPKNGCKVFTTFSCGGGSSMGYKLAGYDVIGNCEIDPKINEMYVRNHHPKYNFLMGVQDFYKEENIKNIPEELYNIDILDGSPPCFVAGTKVKTHEGYKNIETIEKGDFVFTHRGRYREVIDTMQKRSEDLYAVKVQGELPITVTGNHPFYVRTMIRKGNKDKRTFTEPYWKEAKDLSLKKRICGTVKEQDYVAFPTNTKSDIFAWDGVECEHWVYGKKEMHDVKRNIDVSNPFLWVLIGRYIGDGWRRHDRKEVIICCSKSELGELVQIINDAGMNAVYTIEKTTYRATISSCELYAFLDRFGDGASCKHIPEEVLSLPKNLLEKFLEGYIGADGHIETSGKIRCSSVSYDLILGIQDVVAKVYHQPTTITTKLNSGVVDGRICNTKRAYDIQFFKEKRKQQHGFYENGILWIPFREIEKVDGEEYVYNMSVEEDESYTVFNIAVHNCSTFSMAGGREKFWGKEKHFREGQAKQVLDDLFFEYIKVADLLKPKVCVAENVKGMVGGNARGYVNMIFKAFDKAGYSTQLFLLNAATMGVPQARERVFFIARRKDLNMPEIKLRFNKKPIPYGEFAEEDYRPFDKSTKYYARWEKRMPTDESIGDTVKRTENGKLSGFTMAYIKKDKVSPTLTAHGDAIIRFDKAGYPSERDIKCIQTFPQDYDFCGNNVNYVCGMSVPPIMMKGVAEEIYKQLLKNEGNN